MKYFENRGENRKKRSFSNRSGDRQMYPAVCDKCGQKCQVPFRPTGAKEVLCSQCFEKSGGNNSRSRGFGPRREGNRGNFQLDAINAKLDRILELLERNK
jgi:CxxC-x17-CxxC domain-containing protein